MMRAGLVGLMLAVHSVAAQQPVEVTLRPANGVVDRQFSGVTYGVREVRDGRVIVPDTGSMKVIDFNTGSITPIAAAIPGSIITLPGDSTIVLAGGWIFLDGIRAIGMLPRANPVVAAGGYIDGADAAGFVLTSRKVKGDSSDLVRINRATGVEQVVGRIYTFPGVPGGVPAPLYQISEHALLTLDGWIAVLRIGPYRVDWRSPDGTWTLGSPISVPTVRFDEREKRSALADEKRAAGWSTDYGAIPANWWPEVVIHSTGNPRPRLTPDGKILVARTSTAAFPGSRYDIVNRRGEVERQVVLPTGDVIVGFGMASVYVAVIDNGRAIRLERHPW